MWNDETDINAPAQQALNTKSVLQRAFIIIAGPAANFIFAILAYWVVFIAGIPTVKPVIGEILPNTIASQARIPTELEITKIGHQSIQDWESASLALVGFVGNKNVPLEEISTATQHKNMNSIYLTGVLTQPKKTH